VQLANGTRYGLAAMIFTRNEARAWRVSKQLTAGSLWVNCFFVRDLAAPFGGTDPLPRSFASMSNRCRIKRGTGIRIQKARAVHQCISDVPLSDRQQR